MFEEILSGAGIDLYQAIPNILTAISVVGGVLTYFIRSDKELKLKQSQRFHEMDLSYVDFQKTIISYPSLDVAWTAHNNPPELSEDDRIRRTVIFELATSMFEKAFVLYLDAPKNIRKAQWTGWRDYIRGYCAKPEYRYWWFGDHASGKDSSIGQSASYDSSFEDFMQKIFKEVATKG